MCMIACFLSIPFLFYSAASSLSLLTSSTGDITDLPGKTPPSSCCCSDCVTHHSLAARLSVYHLVIVRCSSVAILVLLLMLMLLLWGDCIVPTCHCIVPTCVKITVQVCFLQLSTCFVFFIFKHLHLWAVLPQEFRTMEHECRLSCPGMNVFSSDPNSSLLALLELSEMMEAQVHVKRVDGAPLEAFVLVTIVTIRPEGHRQ